MMSHFTVLVIGDNPEKQLAPYHEFECTGKNDEYVQDVDITADVQKRIDTDGLQSGLGYYGLEEHTVAAESEVARDEDYKFGYAVVQDGKLIKAVDRTNPNKKWDFYQLGGRWTGFFALKPRADGILGRPGLMTDPAAPGRADQARKADIDFTLMRDEAERTARARYRKFFALLGDHPMPQTFEVMLQANPDSIENARTAFWDQPGIQTVKKDDKFRWDLELAEFSVTEDQHAEKARERAVPTFAVVKDSKWYEKGRMGWWACVSDEKDQGDWNHEFSKLLDSVSGDTLLSVYDCHI